MSKALFNSVQLQRPKRSQFDLTHERRMSASAGTLTPCFITECVPSDTFRGGSEILLRLAPLLAPIFDRIELFVHFFFVPNRLLWEEWETFITGGRLGVGVDPLTAPIPPRFEIESYLAAFGGDYDLAQYLGIPRFDDADPAEWNNLYVDAMPFAAYQCIFFNYYRDRNFVADDMYGATVNGLFPPLHSGDIAIGGADNGIVYTQLRQRSYEHDYFTSALPFTQRGQEVLMPIELSGPAPLYYERIAAESGVKTLQANGGTSYGALDSGTNAFPGLPAGSQLFVQGEDFDGTSTSINDFRSAYALQVWLERNAIGGSRYNESTQVHFGVKPQDSRLQRPEYIGGGRIPVQISEVVSTAWSQNETDQSVPLANMGGHGVTYGNTNRFNYYCVEHGFIIGLVSIMPKASYQQGLPRMFRRRSFLDYPWPSFAKLGEQPVYDYEIFTTPASLTEDADGEFPEFGFQSRYADWKYIPSTNHGDFREALLFWTNTRVFDDAPVLSAEFNEVANTSMDRIFVVGASPHVHQFWMYVHNNVSVIRPLPYFGVPNTLGFGS